MKSYDNGITPSLRKKFNSVLHLYEVYYILFLYPRKVLHPCVKKSGRTNKMSAFENNPV